MTSFRARMCLLGVSKTKIYISTPFSPQNGNFWPIFDGTEIFGSKWPCYDLLTPVTTSPKYTEIERLEKDKMLYYKSKIQAVTDTVNTNSTNYNTTKANYGTV